MWFARKCRKSDDNGDEWSGTFKDRIEKVLYGGVKSTVLAWATEANHFNHEAEKQNYVEKIEMLEMLWKLQPVQNNKLYRLKSKTKL